MPSPREQIRRLRLYMMEKIPLNLARSGAIEIAEKLKLLSGGKALDVGTGNGNSILTLISFQLSRNFIK